MEDSKVEITTFWLHQDKHTLKIKKDGTLKASITFLAHSAKPQEVDIIGLDNHNKNILFRMGPYHFKAAIIEVIKKPAQLHVFVFKFNQVVILHLEKPLSSSPTSNSTISFQEHLYSPITGKVTTIFIQAGSVVEKHQPLFIIESMKMENEIRASHNGTIKSVALQEGVIVQANQLLASFHPLDKK
jgi:biotin carboxyl carrier protein